MAIGTSEIPYVRKDERMKPLKRGVNAPIK